MEELITIFYMGKQNANFVLDLNKQKNNVFYNIKYLIWILSVIIFSKTKPVDLKEVNFSYNKVHDKFLNFKGVKISHSSEISKIYLIKKNNTIMSNFNTGYRVVLLIRGIGLGIKYKIKIRDMCYWLDFIFIYTFIIKNKISKINICGHYDRYATWISYICKRQNVNFNISQHGALSNYKLPNKIYCDNFYLFNYIEEKVVKEYLIINDSCNFIIKGFKTNLKFINIDKNKKIVYIGIASQPKFTDKTIDIVRYISKEFGERVRVIVYPHFREDLNKYKDIENMANLQVYIEQKHKNIDILLTYYSTIIYDYMSVGFEGKYICMPPEKTYMSFFELENLEVLSGKQQLNEYISNLIVS